MSKAFLKDKEGNGLKVRVTANGAKAFVYEAKINGKVFSKTLGRFPLMPIPEAQAKARELATTVKTKKQDPRELERQQQEATAVANAAAAALVEADKIEAAAQAALTVVNSITVGEVWALYVEERRPHWGGLHYRDHIRKAAPGGEPFKRGTGTTVEGPLFALMAIPLRDLTAATVEAWAAKEAKIRQTSARLAWRMLKVFLGWCEEQINPVTGEHVYAALLPLKNPAKTKKSREHLGKAGTKSDALQREQLGVWFEAVQKIGNPVTAAYLQTLLLTGARPGEIIGVRWEDMNTQWKGLTIRDKVEGTRVIPLTQYVSSLLAALPRRNELVFSSPSSDTGHITEPNHAHTTACTVAGIDGMTLHGLRRSFKSLTEWLEIPAGVVAQLMGHKPSATAEKHYTVRPLDLLRVHHEKIEAWILEQAKITFDAKATPGALRVVS
ncbi:integrase family protein [Rhodoferax sp.]|uniref:tyrosine-type recombinase/integrase n=1 Tax=Rhodoferax sp. TaxID=50421 RepID=UPI0025F0D0C9|nr:integrase family protein [Rhodoferax sp.]